MAKENILRGRAYVFGDYIDTYQILPDKYWKTGSQRAGTPIPEELGKHAMDGADPSFAAKARAGEYSFIVGGHNFGGGGKSIEEPILAIKGTGVKGVIADSISRYFFRNAINNGLLAMICEGISANVKTGDELEVNLDKGEIKNVTTGVHLQSAPMPDITLKILDMGGYIPYMKKKGGIR
jgi:3-isopropylmalate/(R)-2-methylmalate dehydratase small subunit